MTASELSDKTGVPLRTINSVAELIGGFPVGGNIGWTFSDNAERKLRDVLLIRHRKTTARQSRGRRAAK